MQNTPCSIEHGVFFDWLIAVFWQGLEQSECPQARMNTGF